MKSILLFFTALLCICVQAQNASNTANTKALLDSLNRAVDRAVVKKDTLVLKGVYADDFYFLHATGNIDSKASWLRSVASPTNVMASREHDSMEVELHGDVALVAGTLTVRFPSGSTRSGYAVRYIRLYARRPVGWQLLSHRSTAEWRE
jgi:ketosteroid isomerase-like protein